MMFCAPFRLLSFLFTYVESGVNLLILSNNEMQFFIIVHIIFFNRLCR